MIKKNIDECCDCGPVNMATPADIGGMGPIEFPTDGHPGSGDIPLGRGVAQYEKDKKKKKKHKHVKSFEEFYTETPSETIIFPSF